MILGIGLMATALIFSMEESGIKKPCFDKYSNIIENQNCYTTGDHLTGIGSIYLIAGMIIFFGGLIELLSYNIFAFSGRGEDK